MILNFFRDEGEAQVSWMVSTLMLSFAAGRHNATLLAWGRGWPFG